MDSFDAIIIGAGIGGLTAAGYLAMAGRKVVVIEQDKHVGGTAYVFSRKGFTFPTGPQSITMPDYIANSLYELGVGNPLEIIRDHFAVRRGQLDIMISQSLDKVTEQLLVQFPQERTGIHNVIKVLKEVIAAIDLLKPDDLIEGRHGCINNIEAYAVLENWESVPARDLLEQHLKDKSLKDLLGSQGTGETEMSVTLLSHMWRFMSNAGIWYVKGGIEQIPLFLTERLNAFGGEIQMGKRVKRINIQNGIVAGVELEEGTLIKAPFVISDADYKETILGLVPKEAISDNEREKVSKKRLTSSAFTVFLGVKRDMVDLSAFRGDHLFVKLKEGEPVPWEIKMPTPEDFLMDEIWLSWWSKHDKALAPPGCEALILKVGAPFKAFDQFSGGSRGCHKEVYYSLKEKFADALVNTCTNIVPGLSGAIIVREVATPLTYRYWGHRSEGSVAGWSWSWGEQSKPWAQSLVTTNIPGLLMTGLQSFTRLFYGGMGTSMYSGKYAADIVLSEDFSEGWKK